MKSILNTFFFLSAVSLMALPAMAIDPTYTWNNIGKYNAEGINFKIMNNTADNFCYLKAMQVDNADTEGEEPRCEVYRDNGVWVLAASLGATSDADVLCSSYCYSRQ